MKRNTDVVLMVLLVIIIALLMITIGIMKKEEGKALTSPYTYSIDKLSDFFGEELTCVCNNGILINSSSVLNQGMPLKNGRR